MAVVDLMKMMRPTDALITSAMVIAGIWFSDPNFFLSVNWWKFILATIVPISYIGIAMVHNDIIDEEIDKINAPHRAIPSGKVSIRQAKIYCWVLFAVGTIAGIWLGLQPVIIMALTLVLSLFYNTSLKKTGFLGNISVGITAPSAFLYGDAVASGWENFWPTANWSPALYLFLVSSFLNTSREVSKGIMDIEGDAEYGVMTIAVKFGPRMAAWLVSLLLFFAALLVIIPVINGTFGYLFIIGASVFIFLIVKTAIP
ncbi:MAG: geranylgeranylglycerol-phosphate geranylgeranyltransferase, partial [Candidatus Kariarchaeaceae archaeon]